MSATASIPPAPHATGDGAPARVAHRVAWQLAILVALIFLVFRHELAMVVPRFFSDSEAAHALIAPLFIVLLWYFRRDAMRSAMGREGGAGSLWGIALVALALAIHAFSTWPFNYGYPRQAAIVIALAGAVWTVCGWRVLTLSLPMLLIVLLAVPIGYRQYAFLIARPEAIVLDVTETLLNLLPGVVVTLESTDMFYYTAGASGGEGAIALGDPHRGASLFLSFLSISAFVTFARIRPWWQWMMLLAAAAPIAVLCNLTRVVTQGVITIYGQFDALSAVPRNASAVIALLLCYVLIAATAWVLRQIIVEPAAAGDPPAPRERAFVAAR